MPHDDDVFGFITYPACNTCKHYALYSSPATCAAFPDGIPAKILKGEDKHKKPVRGDNGIQYERRDDGAW